MRKSGAIALLLLTISFSLRAQQPTMKIWPNLAPGSEDLEDKEQWNEGNSVTNVYQPNLTLFMLPKQENPTPAVLVFPGGGYRNIVMEKEGYKVAKWLNENGIAAFVLKYRLNRNDALRDAQRAMSVIRADAKKFNIDESKIGVIGFSAGGHLAGNLVMNHASRDITDEKDSVSSRPDFWIGVYGTYGDIYGPGGRFRERTGIPPAFLVHAENDSKVSVLASIELYTDLKQKGVPAELHVYEQGEHGFALEKNRDTATNSTVADWSDRCIEWLKLRGIL